MPNRCLNRKLAFYATIGFIGKGYVEIPKHTLCRLPCQYGWRIFTIRPSFYPYRLPDRKWINDEDQNAAGSFDKQYPVFRMAEIYLSYAEALNEYDPQNPDVLKYLNYVRYRAGLPGYRSKPRCKSGKNQRERYVESLLKARDFDSRRWKDADKRTRSIR